MDPDIKYEHYHEYDDYDDYDYQDNDEYREREYHNNYQDYPDNSKSYLLNSFLSVGLLISICYCHHLLLRKVCPKIEKYYHKMVFNHLFNEINPDEIEECLYNICSICLEEYDNEKGVCKLRCEHIYHKECISEWFKSNNNCPLCRKDIL